ncbi:MAG TPA: DNA polymerase III subunit gamma and tau, partial [Arachnia sp.]|nr:DNA polymerase III subunit gamma and tau [Arachnia sp.]
MDEDYDQDEYAPIDEGFGSASLPGFEPMEGPGLFDEPEPPAQDGPSLFADEALDAPEPDAAPAAAPQAAPAPSARPARVEAPAAPLALYRRYRPDTFGEIIGQDHVTVPLQRALTNNRVNHAYLFSGP